MHICKCFLKNIINIAKLSMKNDTNCCSVYSRAIFFGHFMYEHYDAIFNCILTLFLHKGLQIEPLQMLTVKEEMIFLMSQGSSPVCCRCRTDAQTNSEKVTGSSFGSNVDQGSSV